MLSMFNESIKKFSEIMYLQQISNIINSTDTLDISAKGIVVIVSNLIIGLALFAFVCKKKRLE